jgi:hypothetical protein
MIRRFILEASAGRRDEQAGARARAASSAAAAGICRLIIVSL